MALDSEGSRIVHRDMLYKNLDGLKSLSIEYEREFILSKT